MKNFFFAALFIMAVFTACEKDITTSNQATVAVNVVNLMTSKTGVPMLIVSGDETVTFLNAVTGEEIYFNNDLINSNELAISQTPLVIGNMGVFFLGNQIVAINMETHKRLWSAKIGRSLVAYAKYRTSPAFIIDNTIYFTSKYYNRNSDATINEFLSLDLRNGYVNWQVALPKFNDVDAPMQVPVCTNKYAFVAVDNTLYAYNRITGEPLWTFSRSSYPILRNPCIANDQLYVAADINNITANDSLFALDTDNGAIVWSRSYDSYNSFGYNPAPVFAGGKVFINLSNGVSCLNAASGTEIWRMTEDKPLSPVFVDGDRLYVSTPYNSTLYSISVSDGSINWNTAVTYENGLSNLTEGPAVIGNLVYVRNYSYYSLDKLTGELMWSTYLHNGLYVNPPFIPNLTNSRGAPVFYSATGMR